MLTSGIKSVAENITDASKFVKEVKLVKESMDNSVTNEGRRLQ